MSDVSIFICINEEYSQDSLKESLDSLLCQDYEPKNIFIIASIIASKDVKRYHDCINIVHEPNAPEYILINQIIKKNKPEYFTIHPHNAVSKPTRIRQQIQSMVANNADVSMCSCDFINHKSCVVSSANNLPYYFLCGEQFRSHLKKTKSFPSNVISSIIRTDSFCDIGEFGLTTEGKELFVGEWVCRALLKGLIFYNLEESLMNLRHYMANNGPPKNIPYLESLIISSMNRKNLPIRPIKDIDDGSFFNFFDKEQCQ